MSMFLFYSSGIGINVYERLKATLKEKEKLKVKLVERETLSVQLKVILREIS